MAVTTLALLLKVVFVVAAMLWIGVSLVPDASLNVLKDSKLLGRVLLANWVLCPLLAMALTYVFPLSSEVTTGLRLLAVAPGGLNAIQFSGKVKGETSLAATLMLVLFSSSLVVTPIAALVVLPTEAAIADGYRSLLLLFAGYVVLPLLIGYGIQRALPRWARLLGTPLNILSTLAFAGAAVLTFSVKNSAEHEIGTAGVAALLAFIFGSMVIGWITGGPLDLRKRVLAATTSNRNVIVCLLAAASWAPNGLLDPVFLSFLALAIPVNMVFSVFHAIKH